MDPSLVDVLRGAAMTPGVLTITAVYLQVPGGLAAFHEDAHRLGLRVTTEMHETGEYEVTLRRVDDYELALDDQLDHELTEMAECLPGGPVERTSRWALPGEIPF